jgi:HSP20 family protein
MSKKDLDEWLWHVSTELTRLGGEVISFASKATKLWAPNADLIETPTHFLIRVELAGVRSEDLKIYFDSDRNSIILRGQRSEPECECEQQEREYHQLEVFYGEFEREIVLPKVPLKTRELKAQYRNGFLNVHIPKDVEKIRAKILEKIYTITQD